MYAKKVVLKRHTLQAIISSYPRRSAIRVVTGSALLVTPEYYTRATFCTLYVQVDIR